MARSLRRRARLGPPSHLGDGTGEVRQLGRTVWQDGSQEPCWVSSSSSES